MKRFSRERSSHEQDRREKILLWRLARSYQAIRDHQCHWQSTAETKNGRSKKLMNCFHLSSSSVTIQYKFNEFCLHRLEFFLNSFNVCHSTSGRVMCSYVAVWCSSRTWSGEKKKESSIVSLCFLQLLYYTTLERFAILHCVWNWNLIRQFLLDYFYLEQKLSPVNVDVMCVINSWAMPSCDNDVIASTTWSYTPTPLI